MQVFTIISLNNFFYFIDESAKIEAGDWYINTVYPRLHKSINGFRDQNNIRGFAKVSASNDPKLKDDVIELIIKG